MTNFCRDSSDKLKKSLMKIINYKLDQDKADFESNTCRICLDSFKDKHEVYVLNCIKNKP